MKKQLLRLIIVSFLSAKIKKSTTVSREAEWQRNLERQSNI